MIRHLDQGMFSISYACRRNGRVEFLGSDMKRFGYNENPDLYVLEDGAPRLLARYDYSVKEGMCRDGRIYVNSTVGTDVMLQCFDMDGNVTAVTDRAGTVESFDICGGPDPVYRHEGPGAFGGLQPGEREGDVLYGLYGPLLKGKGSQPHPPFYLYP